MTEPTRWVVIDDRDSRVQYSSGWSAVSGDTYNNQGNFGPTYRNSLHGTGTDGASLSFQFTGSAARIKGTTALQIDSAGVPNPDWECILDGAVVKRANPFRYVENNWVFCAFDNLPGGEHTIRLNAKPKGRNFWFDYIEYRPTGTVDNEVVVAGRDDADLSYSTGWAALANVGHNTMIRGSTATFRFIGTGIGLYAMFPTELPHNEGQATYSIDNGPSTTFTIPGGGDISIYNRKIFEVTGLSRQAHTIVITYTSTGRTTPLVVAQMFIEGGTNVRASASSNGGGSESSGGSSSSGSSTTVTTANPNTSTISIVDPSTNTAAAAASGTFSTSSSTISGTVLLPGDNATPSDVAGSPSDAKSGDSGSTSDAAGSSADGSSSSQSSTPIGAIVGAVLGAIAILLLLFLLMWYRRRRRIQLRHDAGYQSSPFSLTRDGHHSPVPPAMYANQPISSISASPGSEPPLIDDNLSGTNPPSSVQALAYPAVRSKSGPAFNSPYISNHSPYIDDVSPNEAVSSVTRLVPNRPHQHQQQSSIDHSVSAYSGYTTHTNSSLSSAPSRAVFHEDSGIRLPAPNSEGIVEYPPMYSAR